MLPVIEAAGIGRVFRAPEGELRVLADLELSIDKGRTMSIVGASGSGKSTLLHILGCLDRPTVGRVMIDGNDTSGLNDRELASLRNRKMGFIFQFHHLLPEFSAWENVAMPLLVQGQALEQARDASLGMLDDLGLMPRSEHKPNELSGGEQQRVAIARAMAVKPMVLLADEPTGNLDRTSGEAVAELLWELNRSRQVSLIIVTHNTEIARRADIRMELKDGKLWSR
jgi:lipoprotein-releasing system ATP-binding protein